MGYQCFNTKGRGQTSKIRLENRNTDSGIDNFNDDCELSLILVWPTEVAKSKKKNKRRGKEKQ